MSPATRPTATRECRRPLAEPDQDIYFAAVPSSSNPGPNPHRDRHSAPTNAAKLKPSTIRKAVYQGRDRHPPSSMKANSNFNFSKNSRFSLDIRSPPKLTLEPTSPKWTRARDHFGYWLLDSPLVKSRAQSLDGAVDCHAVRFRRRPDASNLDYARRWRRNRER